MEVPDTNVNLAEIWAQVLRTQPLLEVEDRPESTVDITNNAGSFHSVCKSQKSDKSKDIPDEIMLEAGTGSIDCLAHCRNAPEDLVHESHYGQVQHTFQLHVPPKIPGNLGNKSRTLLLALIHKAKTKVQSIYDYEFVSYSSALSKGEVVDMATIQCVVGRVFDRKEWWIIDRTENLYVEFV
ncbi:hypothetical protein FRC10_009816 [Ceratobasidium sp. 414]|nr:hypothetical protein FRC10_009816 [Ceratobasidium sp. 414]